MVAPFLHVHWIDLMPSHAADATENFGLHRGELRLVTVGPEWAQRYAVELDRLAAALRGAALDIQHVGSTAVPGLLAKPILDIAIAIESFEAGLALVDRMAGLGYRYRAENGIPGRHYFVRGSPCRTHHLHMLTLSSPQWAQHIRFRDRLLALPALALQYAELKRALVAQCAGQRELYQRQKASFIAEATA